MEEELAALRAAEIDALTGDGGSVYNASVFTEVEVPSPSVSEDARVQALGSGGVAPLSPANISPGPLQDRYALSHTPVAATASVMSYNGADAERGASRGGGSAGSSRTRGDSHSPVSATVLMGTRPL